MKPRKILVSGAAGFVGAVLARRLVESGHEVHAVVRPESNLWRLDGLPLPLHKVDLADGTAVRRMVEDLRAEWIFHLATYGAYPFQRDLRLMVAANVLGTLHLVEACLSVGFEVLVNTGSSSEYGFTDHAPSEIEPPRPNSDYAVTKLTSTLYCRAAAARSRARIPTLRLYSVYGPYEEPSRLVPALAVKGLERRLPPLASPGIARDFVYVEDVVDAYLAAATHAASEPGAVFNVGTGRQISIAEAVAIARQELEIEEEPSWGTMPDREWDTAVWVASVEKIRKELGWSPRVSFEEGLRRFVCWLREDPARLELYRTPVRG